MRKVKVGAEKKKQAGFWVAFPPENVGDFAIVDLDDSWWALHPIGYSVPRKREERTALEPETGRATGKDIQFQSVPIGSCLHPFLGGYHPR